MRTFIAIALLSAASSLHAHQWQVSETRCQELAQRFATARQLDGRLMHEYLEGCDIGQLPGLMKQASDAMEEAIERARERNRYGDAIGPLR